MTGEECGADLELSAETMRTMVTQAMERIVEHIESLPEQPSFDIEGGAELARSLREPIPVEGMDFEAILDLLFKTLVPKSFNTAGPGYLAYIPGGGLFHSAVADLIANATNRYVGVWTAAPAFAQIETNVINWFAEMLGYPPGSRGILTTGGSLANFTAIVTARRTRLAEEFLTGTIYASDQIHHSVIKAAILAGFPERNVREVESDDRCCIRIDALKRAISADRRSGYSPFMLVGSAGTTNTGAVDPLVRLSEIARMEDLWLHVDAAYGGFFALTRHGKEIMAGIEQSDSITLDPHKALFLPYGTGSLLVRDGEALRRAHTIHAEYMPPMQEDPELIDFCQYSPELTRDFRGLRVWLPMKLHGIGPFRENLEEKLELTHWAAAELRKLPGVEIVAEAQLSVVAFRLNRPGMDREELNHLNHRLLEGINDRKRVFLTGTLVKGDFVIRICVLSFRTHLDRMRMCLEDIQSALEGLGEAGRR